MAPIGSMYLIVNTNKLAKLHTKYEIHIIKGIGIGDLVQHNASSRYNMVS